MLQAFHFLRPEWFFAIPVIAIILFAFQQRVKRDSGWEKVCDPELLHYQLAQQNELSAPSRILHWLVPLVLLISIFALAGPTWEKKEQPIFNQGNALVIILDLSLSMNAKDIKPSRLERAKLKIIDILNQKKEGQSALIAFAGDAHTVSPLTIDNKTIMSLLPALDTSIMPLSGSHINDALDTARQLLKNSGFSQGDILLLTDGIEQTMQSKLSQNVNKLNKQGYRFSVIGIGTKSGSPIPLPGQGGFVKDTSGQVILSKLNTQSLQQLSRIGGGTYHPLSLDDSDFKALLKQDLLNNNSLTEQDQQLEQWVDAGGHLTLLLIPVALLAFRKGLMSVVFLLLFIPPLYTEQALADDTPAAQSRKTWTDLWFTADQQGQKAFQSQDYQNAAEKFKDPLWRAGAHYRAGDYEKALEHYAQASDANSLYNKGNSLAQLQQFQQAIAAYEEAIKLNPDLSDAIKNRDYLKELIRQQQQQEQQSQQDPSQQENAEEQSENQEPSQQNDLDSDSQQSSQGDDSQTSESEQAGAEQSPSESDGEGSGSQQQESEQGEDQKQSASQQQMDQDNSPPRDPVSPESSQLSSDKSDSESDNPEKQDRQEQGASESDSKTDSETQSDNVLSQLTQEEQQSLKQWLQRIPDNPGELLRIKFRNNSLIKQRQNQTSEKYEGNPW